MNSTTTSAIGITLAARRWDDDKKPFLIATLRLTAEKVLLVATESRATSGIRTAVIGDFEGGEDVDVSVGDDFILSKSNGFFDPFETEEVILLRRDWSSDCGCACACACICSCFLKKPRLASKEDLLLFFRFDSRDSSRTKKSKESVTYNVPHNMRVEPFFG